MRKYIAVGVLTVAFIGGGVSPAVAHQGEAGPYKNLTTCNDAREKLKLSGHKVSQCDDRGADGKASYYFKYSH